MVGLLGAVRPMAPFKAVAETPHLGGHPKLQLEAGEGGARFRWWVIAALWWPGHFPSGDSGKLRQ